MIIGTIKEIKDNEQRVGLTPEGVRQLVKSSHKAIVQRDAGIGAGFSNEEYSSAGAAIVESPLEVMKSVDILVKIKEPLEKEYALYKLFKGKILFTYLHLAGTPRHLTEMLLENNITGIAYETIEKDGKLPLLAPMSQIAGVLSIQYGAEFLQKKYGGRGVTLGAIENAPRAEVIVIGGGNVGLFAAKTSAGMGCNVSLLDISDERIGQLKKELAAYKNLQIIKSTPEALKVSVKKADLLIGAVLVAGAKAPTVVTEEMIRGMKKGSVVIDVAIDQGGCIAGSRPTSHTNPIYKIGDVTFCCIPNMPGQVALQSTQALTNATLPYLLRLADKGLSALKEDKGFLKGMNTYEGKITCRAAADDLKMADKYQEQAL